MKYDIKNGDLSAIFIENDYKFGVLSFLMMILIIAAASIIVLFVLLWGIFRFLRKRYENYTEKLLMNS